MPWEAGSLQTGWPRRLLTLPNRMNKSPTISIPARKFPTRSNFGCLTAEVKVPAVYARSMNEDAVE